LSIPCRKGGERIRREESRNAGEFSGTDGGDLSDFIRVLSFSAAIFFQGARRDLGPPAKKGGQRQAKPVAGPLEGKETEREEIVSPPWRMVLAYPKYLKTICNFFEYFMNIF